MPRHIPSKKVLALLVVSLSLITSVWLISRNTSGNTSENARGNLQALVTKSVVDSFVSHTDAVETDTDEDGLKDWEETLIGTDPAKTDTDGDGTKDGTEVEAGRDPLIKGPNDESKNIATIVSDTTSSSIYSGEGTLTDQMAKDFLGQYLLLKKDGGEVTTDQAAQIAENTLALPQYTRGAGTVYKTTDVRINTQQTGQVVFQQYSDDILRIIKKNSPASTRNEMEILDKAIKSENPAELLALDPIIQSYRAIINDLLVISIPSDAVTIHVELLNSMSAILESIESMRVIFTDPVRSLSGINNYGTNIENVAMVVKKFNYYFVSKGIVGQTVR